MIQNYKTFATLHQSGKPLVLYNVWDAATAQAVVGCGAPAVATASWAIAAAHGYADGQNIPLNFALEIVERIVASVNVPVTMDFEGAYADTPEAVAANIKRVQALGVVGVNFEDSRIGEAGLWPLDEQTARIQAMREIVGEHFFINARHDAFLQEKDQSRYGVLVAHAIDRAQAFAEAGASGFFVPGLRDLSLMSQICAASPLPVNTFAVPDGPSLEAMAQAGAARISHGPGPYRALMGQFTQQVAELMI